jgi:CheY-like chemotaxis protein
MVEKIEGCVVLDKSLNLLDLKDFLSSQPKPDVVTMDYVLPDGNGVEACNLIWDKYPDLPVIMISTDSIPESERVKLTKPDNVKIFIIKPITPLILEQAFGLI